MHTQVKSLNDCQLTLYLWLIRVCGCMCVCASSHLSGNVGSFRSIMLSPTDVLSVAFDRKILIEEDGCFSSGRTGSPLLYILTVYNETPLRGASPWCSERKDYGGEDWILRRTRRNLRREERGGERNYYEQKL